MTQNYNPANLDTLTGTFAEVLKNFSINLENCIPAIVKSYDRTKNVAVVKPAINMISTSGEIIERSEIEIEVLSLCGGGVVLSFPLNEGDTGWIVSCDRDTTLFKQSMSLSIPNTYRRHKYAFGFFIPDKIKNTNISSEDVDSFVIQTIDGQTKITVGSSGVKIKSSSNVDVEAVNVNITSTNVSLGGAGGSPVARVGDSVDLQTGKITSGSPIVKAT